jgi:hypothetical protein
VAVVVLQGIFENQAVNVQGCYFRTAALDCFVLGRWQTRLRFVWHVLIAYFPSASSLISYVLRAVITEYLPGKQELKAEP